jgi:hypothetical protein
LVESRRGERIKVLKNGVERTKGVREPEVLRTRGAENQGAENKGSEKLP